MGCNVNIRILLANSWVPVLDFYLDCIYSDMHFGRGREKPVIHIPRDGFPDVALAKLPAIKTTGRDLQERDLKITFISGYCTQVYLLAILYINKLTYSITLLQC